MTRFDVEGERPVVARDDPTHWDSWFLPCGTRPETALGQYGTRYYSMEFCGTVAIGGGRLGNPGERGAYAVVAMDDAVVLFVDDGDGPWLPAETRFYATGLSGDTIQEALATPMRSPATLVAGGRRTAWWLSEDGAIHELVSVPVEHPAFTVWQLQESRHWTVAGLDAISMLDGHDTADATDSLYTYSHAEQALRRLRPSGAELNEEWRLGVPDATTLDVSSTRIAIGGPGGVGVYNLAGGELWRDGAPADHLALSEDGHVLTVGAEIRFYDRSGHLEWSRPMPESVTVTSVELTRDGAWIAGSRAERPWLTKLSQEAGTTVCGPTTSNAP